MTARSSFQSRTASMREIGLTDRQITELEKLINLMGPAWNNKPPPISSVRRPISALHANLQASVKQLSVMQMRANSYPAQAEALGRLLATAISPDEIDNAVSHLTRLVEVCERALLDMPPQRRSRDAHWYPVALIWEALKKTHDPRDPEQLKKLRPSSSEHSKFREICAICYQEMTGDKTGSIVQWGLSLSEGRDSNGV